MPAVIVVGAQWGDEGKGRVIDLLAAQADVVARSGGGDNAGHTVYIQKDVFKLHLIPSGILRERAVCILGSGMVVNPLRLIEEMDQITAMGVAVSPERLILSTRAHLVTPAHIALDAAKEKARGNQAIGTTLRGIGPAYTDKVERRGIRAGEMRFPKEFAEALQRAFAHANETLSRMGMELLDPSQHIPAYSQAAERLRPFLGDTTEYINRRLKEGATVLCEGAQGALLDIDYGSYPFVTSSSTTVGGALTGLGFGPRQVSRVVGVAKCYNTRVGSGPMPTELSGAMADRLRGTGEHFWDEFGTTTGRPRRCGWFDAVLLRYSVEINGFTELALTKMDILSGLKELQIAVAYELDGQRLTYPPSTISELERVKPVYETCPGWAENLGLARTQKDLPEAALAYVRRIGELGGAPVTMISVGPERDQNIQLG